MMVSRSIHEQMVSAASSGDIAALKACLARGADVHYRDEVAIILAAANGHAGVIPVLAAAGADIDAHNGRPLVRAASNGFVDTVKILLSLGADVNADHSQALIAACTWGTAEMAQVLLDGGADPHASTELPLLRAIGHGNIDTLHLLVRAGADIFVSDAVALLMAKSDDDENMVAAVSAVMADARADFMAELAQVPDTLQFLQAEFVNNAGYKTGDSGLVRALKMECLPATLDVMRGRGVYLTESLLFDAKGNQGRPFVKMAGLHHDASSLPRIFDPAAWNGRIDDMMKAWGRYWAGLWPNERKALPLQPEDLEKTIAAWRLRALKMKMQRPPRL